MGLDLRELRRRAHMTQKQVAAECGIGLRTLARWEKEGPDRIPHSRYVRLLAVLEGAIRLRKEVSTDMAHDFGRTRVVFDDPHDDDGTSGFTVPVPEGLSEEFTPSRPVSDEQYAAWATRREEPYPGFAEEIDAWDRAWSEVASAQRLKDTGQEDLRVPSVHPGPEQDGQGRPVVYKDEPIINEVNDPDDPDNGEARMLVPDDDGDGRG